MIRTKSKNQIKSRERERETPRVVSKSGRQEDIEDENQEQTEKKTINLYKSPIRFPQS